MPQVKIFLVKISDLYDYNGDFLRQSAEVIDSVSDWETITDNELELLYQYADKVIKKSGGYRTIIVIKDDTTIAERLSSIKDFLKAQNKKEKEQKKEREKQEALREKNKKEEKLKRDRAKLERLAKQLKIEIKSA